MRKLFTLDKGFLGGDAPVVVVGTGRMALLAHTCLLQEGVAVAAFCDPSGASVGLEVMGRPVVGADALVAWEPTPRVVWAGEDPARAEAELASLGVADAWADLRAYDVVTDAVWTFM